MGLIALHLFTIAACVYIYRPQRSCGQGNIFTPVCHSVHRAWSASVHAGIPPLEQTPPLPRQTSSQSRHPPPRADPPGADTPQEQTPHPRSRHHPPHPREQTHTPPPQEADSSIRSMSSQYASYWNAFLY